jgi:putative Holliday junction resolvase
MSSLNTVIGFDFGMRYIGVAVGETITMSAQPYTSLLATQGHPNWEEIKKLFETWQPDACIVGIPLHLDGRENNITVAAQNFMSALSTRFKIPVYGAEERLTTVEAKAHLFAQGGFKSLSKQAIDGLSACLILEGWFREHVLTEETIH